nr:hypothetical protein [Micromonospora sp. NBRC 107566]
MDWARRRRAERGARRQEAAGARALNRLEHLGPAWHVVEWPRADDAAPDEERTGFLAIGPGGVFAVTVADHGRARVMLAGDVVQINGKRPPYVSRARRDARRAGKALTAAVGLPVPVAPVLTFVGSGVISVYGVPRDCMIATHRELDRLLIAGGARISAETAQKLSVVASHPSTWLPAGAEDYRWYGEGRSATDKRPVRR